MSLLELFGYFASVLIAVSLMMSNIKKLRWINFFGALAFSIYGYAIDAYPVFFLNGWIAIVNVYYLMRLYNFKDQFDLVRLQSVHTPLFTLLISHYGSDIHQFFPQFDCENLSDAVALLIFRNMKPVGIFAYQQLAEKGKIEVLIDYVIPDERDFKTAKFMFDRHSSQLKKEGVELLICKTSDKIHQRYLHKVGFIKQDNYYQLALS